MRDISLPELEAIVKDTLKQHPNDTVELSDLSELTYRQLRERFGEYCEVRGIINILRKENGNGNDKQYVLHVSGRRD